MTRGGVNGYPSPASVRVGEDVRLHISTESPWFRADFYRAGAGVSYAGSAEWDGETAPERSFDEDWAWPAVAFTVPAGWRPGAYVVVLSDGNAPPAEDQTIEELDARSERLLLVVRPATPSPGALLYKLPLTTYHAYNQAGGGSLYGRVDFQPTLTPTVSVHRPGGGIGGPVKGMADAFDSRTPRQSFAHWDARFLRWLEESDLAYDLCTDLDIHSGLDLSTYRLIVTAGHDEYWTAQTRATEDAYLRAGGNLAIFGGNTCWWRTHLSGSVLTCDKFPPDAQGFVDPDSVLGCRDKWWEFEPEEPLLGVSYRHGGGHWDGARDGLGFTVLDAGHWVFDGTGLRDGDVIGAEHALVGYECDGAGIQRGENGELRLAESKTSPAGLALLGAALLPTDESARWNFPAKESADPHAATMVIFTTGGTVFNAATTDWARALPGDPVIATITRNVIEGLLR